MAITPLPTPPSREDPNNFAERADALLAALVTFVTECNATAADINADEISAAASASTATTKAGDAAAARDIAMAAVNYKGVWSSLSGALAIPASAYHSGSIWMLTESVANVALETPGVSAKWINVTPASGLGSAAYQPSSAFQPAIGAITALLKSTGSGNIAAASAADIVAAIGATAVQNATNAATAATVTSLPDGAVSAAAKIANGIITWAKMVSMSSGKLIGRSTSGGGSPEEVALGSGLQLVSGVLSVTETVGNSTVRLNTAAGYGSTNTKIRRFTNTVVNTGSDITYADSATNGATFTINTAGVYAISYNDNFSGGGYIGISVNSSQLSTSIESITVSDIAAVAYMANSHAPVFVGATLRLGAGDVVRAHTGGSVSGVVTNACQFTITRVL